MTHLLSKVLVLFVLTFIQLGNGQSGRPNPTPANPNQFPYHVSIQKYDYRLEEYVHEGSGTILDESHILTNTFMSPSTIYSYQIVAGIVDLEDTNGGATVQIRNLTEIFWNPTYCYVTSDLKNNNIGVLRLAKPFEFNEAVNSIPLPPHRHLATGTGVITGWVNRNVTTQLQHLEIPLVPSTECGEFYSLKYKHRTGRMCAGFMSEEQEGVAQDGVYGFDEGHPIVCKDDGVIGHDYLCGVFSLVHPIVEIEVGSETVFVGGYPIVFSDVASYIPWIEQMMTINMTAIL